MESNTGTPVTSNGSIFKTDNIIPESTSDLFSGKNVVIIILVILLILSILGINIFTILGSVLEWLTNLFGPLVQSILSFFGYTTGSVIVKTSDVVGDVTKGGIDLATGAVEDVGNLLKTASQSSVDAKVKTSLDNALSTSPPSVPPKEPEPTPASNPIQNPISSSKSQWCLVGEYQDKRGCIEISESDKCMSGQIYPNREICLNPTLSQNK
jgi:hypothetical protein